jgi:hypothetical protein
LEEKQDRLSLLYWTLLNLAGQGLSLRLPEAHTIKKDTSGDEGGGGSSSADGSSGGMLPPVTGNDGALGASDNNQINSATDRFKSLLPLGFLKGIKDAARKSLFSLILSGGLVLTIAASGNANINGNSDNDANFNNLKSHTDYSDFYGFSPFSPFHGEEIKAPPKVFPEKKKKELSFIVTKMRSKVLGRTLDLGFLPPLERDMPFTEADNRAKEILNAQAQKRGLSLEEWIYLTRTAFAKERTIYLSDLDSENAPFILLSPHLPGIAQGLVTQKNKNPYIWNLALQGAVRLKGNEGVFWERLYYGIREEYPIEEYEAAKSAIFRLYRKNWITLQQMEYAGTLTPIKDVEAMSYERAIEFIVKHMSNYWGNPKEKKLPQKDELIWIASDLYNASRIFKVPLTFLSIVTHYKYEVDNTLPGILDIYSGSLEIVKNIARLTRTWEPSSRLLCDLDELAQSLSISQNFPYPLRLKRDELLYSVLKTENSFGLFN